MTRMIRFDAPPPRNADPRINALGPGAPSRARRSDGPSAAELLSLTKRLTKGGLAPTELAAIQRRLDEARTPAPSDGAAEAAAGAGAATLSTERMLAIVKRLQAEDRDPAELLALLEELGATGKLSPEELKALKAQSGSAVSKPDEVVEVLDSGRARSRALSDDLAARLVAKGRAPLPPLNPTERAEAARGDRADDPSSGSASTLQDRLVAKGRAPLGGR
jgi:hypothetical protein